MATSYFQQESDDLSSCTICFEVYDRTVRKPKILPCAHTFCLPCLIAVVEKLVVKMDLPCPVCQTVLKLSPEHPISLPNNSYALHIIQLNAKLDVSQHELVVVNRRLEETRAELDREKAKKIRLASPSRHQLRRKLAVKPNQHNVMMGNNNQTQHSSSSSHHHLLSTHSVWAYGESQQLFLHEPPKPPMSADEYYAFISCGEENSTRKISPESIEALWRMVPAEVKARIGEEHAQILKDYHQKMDTFLKERMENRGEAPEVLTIDEQDNEIPVIDILD